MKESKDKYNNLKKENNETIEKLNIKLNNYSTEIDKDKKYLIEEENKIETEIFNRNKEQQEAIDDFKDELKEFKDKYNNLKKENNETIEKLNIKLNNYSTDIEKITDDIPKFLAKKSNIMSEPIPKILELLLFS